MKISVLGATGYTGEELLRMLSVHPEVQIQHITSESQTGAPIETTYPHLARYVDAKLESMKDAGSIAEDSDFVFICLPHGHAMEAGKAITAAGARVIDLGADYRFRDTKVYEKWYNHPHTHQKSGAVYGLTELYRDQVRQAKIVGNPGCYTTASILALAPLIKNKIVRLDSIIVDAKSGISGAGRGLSLNSHIAEMYENVKPYGAVEHRHTPEIEQALSEFAGSQVVINFTPHLIPMSRGILSTCYAVLNEEVQPQQVDEAFQSLYGGEFFIRLMGRGGYPATKYTRGSNFCDIGWHVDPRTRRVIVLAAIDNLVKGAAGQAIQNMNVMAGLSEKTGLMQAPLYP